MDVGSKSPGLDSPEVICLSDDDSEAPPSVHHDDAEDVEDGTATGEAQDRIVDQLDENRNGAGEVIESDTVTGGDQRSGGVVQHDGSGLEDHSGGGLETDHVQGGGDASTKGRDCQGVESKSGTDPLLDQPAISHAAADVAVRVVSQAGAGADVVTPVNGVTVHEPPKPQPPQNLILFDEPRVTLLPTVGWPRRAKRGASRRDSSSGMEDLQRMVDQVVSIPARGAGRGRSRRSCRGARGVTPLSLRQFYDSGGRDYVEYLMRHIEAGVGRRKQQQITINTAPRLTETLQNNTITGGSIGDATTTSSNPMPTLTLVAFSAGQLIPAFPAPLGAFTPLQTVPTGSSSSAIQPVQSPSTSSTLVQSDQNNVATLEQFSSTGAAAGGTGSKKESSTTSPEYGAVDLSATGTGSRPLQPEMTSPTTSTRAPLPLVAQCNADSQRLRGDVRSWSVDDVTKFVAMVPGCSEYTETFHREKIDGMSLTHLSDWHLLNVLNMRLGPALRLRIAVDALRAGGPTPPTTASTSNWHS